MTNDQMVQLVRIARQKADELFDDLLAELHREEASGREDGDAHVSGDGAPGRGRSGYDTLWVMGVTPLSGSWTEVGELSGVTYVWPDGNVDNYRRFVIYEGDQDFAGTTLALGHKENGEVIGFASPEGASRRGITYFQLADDFATTNEALAMIRGGGATGRAGFSASDALPSQYAGFRTEMLRDRIVGKWGVQAVVAELGDHETMLAHTAIQARLRGIS